MMTNKNRTLHKSGLLATDFSTLSPSEQANALHIFGLFEPERRRLKNILRLGFSLAGFSWFFIMFPSWLGLSPAEIDDFRVNQYQIYLILMTLWGYDLKLHEKRLGFLLGFSALHAKKWYEISEEEIRNDGKLFLFEIFRRKVGAKGTFFHIGFIWILMIFAVVQFVMQARLLFL